MTSSENRLAELLGAAAAGQLSHGEAAELDALCAEDPGARAERDALLQLSARLDGVSWEDVVVPPHLEHSIAAAMAGPETDLRSGGALGAGTQHGDDAERAGGVRRARRWPRRLGILAAAVALVAAGSVATLGLQALDDDRPAGPPGQLGAYEQVSFAPETDSADVQADLVAHTWGTEAVLVVDGLEDGAAYEVSFVDEAGREVSAGAFLGSDVTIDCRMNAAVLREDVRTLQIAGPDGSIVRTAALPRPAD